jgi:hypothetical protein
VRTFFVQPAIALEELNDSVFFLLNYGHGYTDVGVLGLTVDMMAWHVRKLQKKLKEEGDARKQALDEVRARSRSFRR